MCAALEPSFNIPAVLFVPVAIRVSPPTPALTPLTTAIGPPVIKPPTVPTAPAALP